MTKSNRFVHLNKCIRFIHKCCPKTCVMSGEQMAPHDMALVSQKQGALSSLLGFGFPDTVIK